MRLGIPPPEAVFLFLGNSGIKQIFLGKIFGWGRKFCPSFWGVNGGKGEKIKKQNHGRNKWVLLKH
jgi:hypothetical protein